MLQIAPLKTYSRLVRLAAGIPLPVRLRQPVFGAIATRLGMDLAEAEFFVNEYRSFGDLFVRRLQRGSRPFSDSRHTIISPVDACLSASGTARAGDLIQAKGIEYPLAELVGSVELARALEGGSYVTMYLSPKDYHRIHSPLSGRVVMLRHIKGTLFPVKPYMVRNLRGLFVRNERIVIEMETEIGKVAMVCVAAAGVGNITTNVANGERWRSPHAVDVSVEKGDEIAAFNLGSTVILIFSPGAVDLEDMEIGQEVRMGQQVARAIGGQELLA